MSPSQATTITNARVFDGARLRDWTSVRFADGIVTDCATGSTAQDGDEVIDAEGGTILPGLIDSHVHLVPGALSQALIFGVTTVLDMFSKPDVVAVAKQQAGTRSDVADVRSVGIGATAPGGHPSMMYAQFPTLTGPEQAEQFVADRVAEGSDYLKIFSGAAGRWPSLDLDTITALTAAAHRRGLVVVAHINSVAGVREVVSAGVDVVAHVPVDGELDKALVQRIAAAGIVVGPTLATIENVVGEQGGAAVAGDPRLAQRLGDAWARRLTSGAAGRRPGMPAYSRAEENVGRMVDARRHDVGGHRRTEPWHRVRGKSAPRAGTARPLRHYTRAGTDRRDRRSGKCVQPHRPRAYRPRSARGFRARARRPVDRHHRDQSDRADLAGGRPV